MVVVAVLVGMMGKSCALICGLSWQAWEPKGYIGRKAETGLQGDDVIFTSADERLH